VEQCRSGGKAAEGEAMARARKEEPTAEMVEVQRIEQAILWLRGQRVMLDTDLAVLYGVSTKALNQAVKRNRERFPRDFMFRLTRREKAKVVTDCDHLARLKFSSTLPFAFTEHGAIMLASLLNSPTAIEVSLQVVRTFVRLREILASHAELSRRLDELEKRHDRQFTQVFAVLRDLLDAPDDSEQKRIGFGAE
jgi:hypothetical protein